MAGRYGKILSRIKPFFIGSSINRTIKTSHVVIIACMLIPLLLSIAGFMLNTWSYDQLITSVDKTNQLIQIVKADISNELWDTVAGNKPFAAGKQYAIIEDINARINDIMGTSTLKNRQHLEVAVRAMNTLTRYVDRLKVQMEESYPVIENERILDEIRAVAALVTEILQDFIVLEIESAAQANELIKRRTFFIGALELAIIFFVTIFSVFMQSSVTSSVDTSIKTLVSLSGRIADGDLSARAEDPQVQEFGTLTENLNTMAGKIKALVEANIQEQRNLQKSEMKALQAQITPHFLYNTLDSIIWLAEGKQFGEVVAITRAFSNFFRLSLNRGSEWLSVRDEFHHIENYLTIQKIRYRDILDYSIEYECSMEEKIILKLLLQPLVENALYHGIKNKRGRGTIKVRGWQEARCLCFSVEDNGIGMKAEHLETIKNEMKSYSGSETSNLIFGLYNVSRRLELYYNRQDLLEITSVYREGTTVNLRVPEVSVNV